MAFIGVYTNIRKHTNKKIPSFFYLSLAHAHTLTHIHTHSDLYMNFLICIYIYIYITDKFAKIYVHRFMKPY